MSTFMMVSAISGIIFWVYQVVMIAINLIFGWKKVKKSFKDYMRFVLGPIKPDTYWVISSAIMRVARLCLYPGYTWQYDCPKQYW